MNDDGKCLKAFIEWSKQDKADWPLGPLRVNGQFDRFMDADTDTAWIGFQAGFVAQADVQQRLKEYIRQTRSDLELMKSKTVQPSAAEVAEAICVDLEKIAAGLSTVVGGDHG